MVLDGPWLLRLSIHPSFEGDEAIGVVTDAGRYSVIWRRWERAQVEEPLRLPVERLKHRRPLNPVITTRQREVEPSLYSLLLTHAKGLTGEMLPQLETVFLDGCSFELITTDGCGFELLHDRSQQMQLYRWHGNSPNSWHLLHKWFVSAWVTLAAALELPNEDLSANVLQCLGSDHATAWPKPFPPAGDTPRNVVIEPQ
jgi:hypothetical protein